MAPGDQLGGEAEACADTPKTPMGASKAAFMISPSKSTPVLHPGIQEDDLDPSTAWLYKPHTVTMALLAVAGLIYWSQAFNPSLEEPTEEQSYINTKTGILFIVFMYCLYSTMQGPNTSMVRPHPAMWRLVHGMVMCYTMFMVYLLFQSVHDARRFMRHLDSNLGVALDERAYGAECRLWIDGELNLTTLKDTLFDEFVIAHTLGWWGKALVFRNLPFLWLLSVGFEIMELTYQHMLPNFNECWWDSWILDVAVCNLIGLWAGMKTVSYFSSRPYDWQGLSKQPTLARKAGRAVLQFTPESYERFSFRPTSSPKRCVQVLLLLAFVLTMELNAFFLKYVLWVPPRSYLNSVRLALWFLLALPGCREFYDYMQADEHENANLAFLKLGPYAWLCMVTILVELLCIVKFSVGVFPQHFPLHVKIFWGALSGFLVVSLTVWQIRRWVRARRAKSKTS